MLAPIPADAGSKHYNDERNKRPLVKGQITMKPGRLADQPNKRDAARSGI